MKMTVIEWRQLLMKEDDYNWMKKTFNIYQDDCNWMKTTVIKRRLMISNLDDC